MHVVAVTGITGKSGQWFAKRLESEASLLKEYGIRISVRETYTGRALDDSALNVEKFIGDITDAVFCAEFCSGADTLIHIAGIRLSFPLLRIAAENGVKRFVLVYTTGVYSKYKAAAKPYAEIETETRKLAEEYGISLTILRPTMIYGDLNDKNISVFIKMVDKLLIFPVINGANYDMQPVYAKDLGEAYYRVLMAPEATKNKSYNLSGKKPIFLKDIFKTIADQLGKKITMISFPFWFAYTGACCLYILSLRKMDYREKVQRMIEPRVFDHEDAKRDFGYCPVDFGEGVREEILSYLRINNLEG